MKNNPIIPKLTLVGAGPGDPDLITIKGIKAIASADVILYDALVNTDLLKYASARAKIIFVGKRAGYASYTQQQINELIIEHALTSGHVVRLKGGDPFIFGRGYEELEYAQIFNIPVEVIPGISSHTSVPALQHIPLTKRGINESFWVLTGTNAAGTIPRDVYRAAESNASVVILMGLSRLKEIAQIFIDAGKASLPAAVIQNGSLPDEKIVVSDAAQIYTKTIEANISSPAIIIFGEVVSLHPLAKKIFTEELRK